MKRILNCSMSASRSFSSLASVTSSLTSRMTSPVSLSTTSCAATLPTSSSSVDRQAIDLRLLQLLDRRLGELGVLLDDDLAADLDVARRALAGEEIVLDALGVLAALLEVDRLGVVEVVEQVLRRVAERAQQHRRVHLPAAVDADVDDVLRVELEVEPRAAVRDDARGVEQLAARVRLALVVVEEDAGAAVQLADDDALGAVDDERAGVRHQRDLAEVDLLLLDVADDALAAVAGVVDHQLGRHLDRRGERHAALAALVDVVLRLLEVVARRRRARSCR